MTAPTSPSSTEPRAPRRTRWGLYLPLVALAAIVAGWSAFWYVARNLVENGISRAIADAAQRGDAWTCRDRTIGGFPFRFEIRCSDLTLARSASGGVVRLSTGPVLVVGQPHTPAHLIMQADGPLRADLADGRRIEVRWDLAEASRSARNGELERFSLDVRKPVVSITAAGASPAAGGSVSTISAAALEAHLRRNPALPAADGARDLFLRIGQMASGDLDGLLGDANPADVELQAMVNRSELLANGLTPATLEAWRVAGGRLEMTRFALRKGIKRIEAKGEFALDEERRVAGRIEPSVANIDQFAGIRLRGQAMDLASALSGRPRPEGADGLKPLPAIDLRGGRVGFGPVRLPLPPLAPLY